MYRAALPRAGGRRTRWSAAVLVVATTVAATGVLPNQVSAHPAEPADATAGGLPVVLVHGLNSSARVWQDYTGERGFLASIGRRGFAVGDGQAPGVLDMGDWTTPTARTNTIAENAAILAAYIDGVRALTGAEYVDLVAHSMGGLVARYYIDHLMGERDVARLVMLGTPNEGSDCANLPAALGIGIPATLELRPSYLSQVFNRTVTDRNGVPFYVLAGTNVTDPVRSPCASVPSDGVVSQASATTVDGLAAELPVGHTALTGSREAFDAFVAPVLTAAFDPAVYAVTPSPPTEEAVEQFAAVASAHVPRGGRAEFVVHLDAVAVAAFALFDPSRSVQVEVRGASGNLIALDPAAHGVTIVDDPDALVHLGYGFANPRPGPWRVTLLATEATPPAGAGVALAVRTTGGAQLEAATSTLLGRVGAPVEISAQLSADGQPVAVQEAVAVIRRPDGVVVEVPLAVDGAAARADWQPEVPGIHGIDVRLAGVTSTGQTVERVALLAVEIEPPPAQVWQARALALALVGLLVAALVLLAWRWRRRRPRRLVTAGPVGLVRSPVVGPAGVSDGSGGPTVH